MMKREIISFYDLSKKLYTGRTFSYYTYNCVHKLNDDFYKLLIEHEEKRSKYYKYTFNYVIIEKIGFFKNEIRIDYNLKIITNNNNKYFEH